MRQNFPLYRRFPLITTVAVLFAFLGATQLAHAYSTEGLKWLNNLSITSNFTSMSTHSRVAWTNGMHAWNVSPAPVVFAGIGFNVTLFAENDGNSGFNGYTTYDFGGICTLSSYSIFAKAYSHLNTFATDGFSDPQAQNTAAHELGHVIGLGHSSSIHALMYFSDDNWYQFGINTPQSDDVAGATAIYGTAC